jgi:hypothetical protein
VQWRASVWTLDGGAEPIRIAARIVDPPLAAPGEIAPVPLDLAGLPQSLAVARVALNDLDPLRLGGEAAGLQAVSTASGPLAPVNGSLILPQSKQLWLVARDRPGPIALAPVTVVPGEALALALPPLQAAFLTAAPPEPGRQRLWLAESGLGQPWIEAGRGTGVAAGSALALACGCQPTWLSNGAELPDLSRELPLRATAMDLAELQARALDGPFAEALPPRSALPMHLPEGAHRVHLDLAAGAAAIAGWRGPHPVTVWTGRAAVSRTVEGDVADLLLVNTGSEPAPAAVTWTGGDAPPLELRPGEPVKRFFGSAGSLDLPVTGGDLKRQWSLTVVGGTATLTSQTGHVQRGTRLSIFRPGRVTIDHGPGLLAAWIEGDTPPWPEPTAEAVTLPAHLALHDAAMALALSPATPILLHATTTAPVIVAFGDEPPVMFPAGADLYRYLPPGPEHAKIFSPHDGPLAGTLDLAAAPVAEATEGVGATVAVAPGGMAAFAFKVEHAGPVGVGIRAEPDNVAVRLLDAAGRTLGEGVAQLQQLRPGRYVLEARVPPDGAPTLVRPALVGLVPRPNGPPQNVVNDYLELAGRAPIPAAAKGPAP